MFFGIALIWVGFLSALGASTLYFAVGKGRAELLGLARGLFALMSACLIGSAAYLLYLILQHQFQVEYVYQYSSRELPTYYLVSCFWGGQQGTFLLWAMYGGIAGLVLMRTARAFEGWTMFFLGLVQSFLLLLLVQRNPFVTLPNVPLDGQGLNPLLQDPWMVIHPPILFMGFTAMVVPFVFALGALMKNDADGWIKPVMPWAVFASWVLGTGLVMGGFWAYKVLGWGGYWGWDPVENSSLIPWLTNTALIHGIMLQRTNGSLKRTNLLLGICSFLLVVWGTFLTRSGVLADFSVHSFLDLGITGYLVAFIVVFAAMGLGLFFWRFGGIKAGPVYSTIWSREFFVLTGVILLGISAGLTLLGMSSPLISQLFGPPSAVQSDYYNRVMVPVAIVITFGMAFAILLKWRGNDKSVMEKFVWPLALTAVTTVALWLWRVHQPLWLLLTAGGSFAFFSNVWAFASKKQKEPARAGAYLAHLGFGILLIGAVVSNGYETKEKLELPKDQAVRSMGYQLTYKGILGSTDGKSIALVDVEQGGRHFAARTRMYYSSYNQGVMRKPAIDRGLGHDLYIAPIEELNPARESLQAEMKVNEVTDVGGYRVRFDAMRLENAAGLMSGAGGKVYADLTVTDTQGNETKASPALVVAAPGQQSSPGAMPSGLGQVAITGMQVNEKKVQLSFDGQGGMPDKVEIRRGETVQLGKASVQFVDFRVPDAGAMKEGRPASVFVDLIVTPQGGKSSPVAPSVSVGGGAPREESLPAKLAGGGEVKIADLKADDQTVKLDWSNVPGLHPETPPTLAVEVTVKPLISLFWLGTLLTSIGFLVTLVRRAREWGAARSMSA